MPFLVDFWNLLGRCLEGFGAQVEGQVDQKFDHMASCWPVGRSSKNASKLFLFQYFWVPWPSDFETKLTKKRSESVQKWSKILVSILLNFLIDFGGQLGSKILPKPSQNRWKIYEKGTSKSIKILYVFWMAFWWLLGPTWPEKPPKMEPGEVVIFLLFSGLEGSWGGLGASWDPRASWF